jgi:hypothetical protein
MGTHWEFKWNITRTHWELKGKIVGTHWEPGKNEKKKKTSPNLKVKKSNTTCLGLPIGCIKFLFAKKSSSSFLAWANTPCKRVAYLFTSNWKYYFCTKKLCKHRY